MSATSQREEGGEGGVGSSWRPSFSSAPDEEEFSDLQELRSHHAAAFWKSRSHGATSARWCKPPSNEGPGSGSGSGWREQAAFHHWRLGARFRGGSRAIDEPEGSLCRLESIRARVRNRGRDRVRVRIRNRDKIRVVVGVEFVEGSLVRCWFTLREASSAGSR